MERCESLIAVRKGEFVRIGSYIRWGLKIAMGEDESGDRRVIEDEE